MSSHVCQPWLRHALLASALSALIGCARGLPLSVVPLPVFQIDLGSCIDCSAPEPIGEVRSALEARINDLKSRGGACRAYGQVLESSLASGRIAVRPYMWRVGQRLASAQAQPGGEIHVAREIDSLNVGVRKVADVVKSVEHEAAHIAFAIPSGQESNEASVDVQVSECRTEQR